jgi:hypothetical protein
MSGPAWVVRAFATVTLFASVACSNPSSAGGAAGSSASASPAASAAAPPAASASGKPAAAAPTGPVAWNGTYSSAPGSMYVYDGGEWKGVHFRGDDASIGLGDGPLTLTVDAKTGIVRGTGTGPIGDVILTGAVTGEELTFSVLRKDTADRGFTGTGSGKLSGDTCEGVMRLSRGDAHVIREAKFTLSKKAP